VAHASEDADKSDAGVPPNLRSFGLSFNSTGANWDGAPNETWAAFGRVFRMECERGQIVVCLWVPGRVVIVPGEVEILGAVECVFGYRRGSELETPI
jgi:hypothetical protein